MYKTQKSTAIYHVIFLILMLFAISLRAAQTFADDRAAATAAPRFLEAISDVPLMPEMQEIGGESVVFDNPEGRVVQAAAYSTAANIPEIKAFYGSSLPQLGWEKVADTSFVRQSEKLSLSVNDAGDYRVVHFMLEPR